MRRSATCGHRSFAAWGTHESFGETSCPASGFHRDFWTSVRRDGGRGLRSHGRSRTVVEEVHALVPYALLNAAFLGPALLLRQRQAVHGAERSHEGQPARQGFREDLFSSCLIAPLYVQCREKGAGHVCRTVARVTSGAGPASRGRAWQRDAARAVHRAYSSSPRQSPSPRSRCMARWTRAGTG